MSSSHSYVIDMQAVRHIKQAFPYESSGFRVGSLQLYIVSRRRHFPSRAHHCPANLLTPAITRDLMVRRGSTHMCVGIAAARVPLRDVH